MDIQAEKLLLIEKLLKTQDEGLIRRIKNLLSRSYEENLKPMTQEQLQEKLDRSEEDIKAGRVYSQEEVVKYFKNKSR